MSQRPLTPEDEARARAMARAAIVAFQSGPSPASTYGETAVGGSEPPTPQRPAFGTFLCAAPPLLSLFSISVSSSYPFSPFLFVLPVSVPCLSAEAGLWRFCSFLLERRTMSVVSALVDRPVARESLFHI